MELLTKLFYALWDQDFIMLTTPSVAKLLYYILFIMLFLENAILPAAFLPGDSLLILVGALCAKGVLNFVFAFIMLITAASFGYWLSYMQGRWLSNLSIMKNWLSYCPENYHQLAYRLFCKRGLSALLIGRFIAFVRTLLPIIVGYSGLSNASFQLFNWISSILWVIVLMTIGYLLSITSVFLQCEKKILLCLMLLPFLLAIISLISSILVARKIKCNKK